MPRRTLSDARRILEQDLAPTLNDFNMRQAQEILGALEANAKTEADAFVTEQEAEILEARETYLHELTETRDSFDDLTAEAASGRLTASEHNARLGKLRDRQTAAEAQLAKTRERVEVLEQIEADPLTWFDDLVLRFPAMPIVEVPW